MKKACMLLILALLFAVLAGAALGEETVITSKDQLNRPEMKVGVSTGSSSVLIAEKELPDAKLVYYEENTIAYEAVAQGKLDAFIYDREQMQKAIDSGRKEVRLLDENMDEGVSIGVGVSPVSKIPDLLSRLNTFIAEIKADGTLDDMFHRWVDLGSEEMPDIPPAENPQYHLTVGTSATVPPYSFYAGTDLTGFDIELGRRFAAWLGAEVSFRVYDYGAIVPAAVTGEIDCIMANLNITPERREALPFSDELFTHPIAIMVKADASLEKLKGKRIGVQTGTTFDEIVLEAIPDAQISYFNTYPDLSAALEANKIDAFPGDEPVLLLMMSENNKLALLDSRLDSFEFGFVLPKTEKGEKLRKELNAWIAGMKESGELDQVVSKWTSGPEEEKTVPEYASFPAPKGVLTMVTEGAFPPMDYYRGEDLVGLEIDLAAQFCEDNGYGLSLQGLNFDGILPAIQAGKADFAAAGITITEERKESVYFSDPYYVGGTMLAVLKSELTSLEGGGFLDTVRESFNKTFIREDRWKLFLRGVLTTLLITFLSILCGTLLGFAVYMLCRNGNRVANTVTRFCVWLVQGMPLVVLLMILYYIIFGSASLSGVTVSVIAFTLTFGAAVFGLLKMGVGAVEPGQYEAACALGYTNRRTFFKIILPQALPHIMPSYKGEIIGLIKATSIVGYIAVQDLTKMGDIVRSRTYEAFFPLIAITVIYFLLEGLLGFLVSRLSFNINPKRRKPEKILKGVKTDD